MVGTHAPGAYSKVAANTTVVPLYSKCAHSDCLSWLPSISDIFQAHFRASCLRLHMLAANLYLNLTVTLNYSVQNIRNDVRQIYVHTIELTSVGLAHAHPNYS